MTPELFWMDKPIDLHAGMPMETITSGWPAEMVMETQRQLQESHWTRQEFVSISDILANLGISIDYEAVMDCVAAGREDAEPPAPTE